MRPTAEPSRQPARVSGAAAGLIRALALPLHAQARALRTLSARQGPRQRASALSCRAARTAQPERRLAGSQVHRLEHTQQAAAGHNTKWAALTSMARHRCGQMHSSQWALLRREECPSGQQRQWGRSYIRRCCWRLPWSCGTLSRMQRWPRPLSRCSPRVRAVLQPSFLWCCVWCCV
jgi:hypothetical protein